MKRPAIFFDRDNTLIQNDGYLGDPAAVVLIDGAANAIARLRSFGYAIVIVSNQSGVARGMFTEDAVRAVNTKMSELLQAQNPDALIDCHEFCPYHASGTVEEYRQESDLRKPKPGMIFKAAEAMDLDLAASWVIGDAPRDIEAGRAAGCKTILIHDPKLSPSEAAREAAMGEPDYAVPSLRRAVEIIQRQTPGAMPVETVAPVAAAQPTPPPPVKEFEPEPVTARASEPDVRPAAYEEPPRVVTSARPIRTTSVIGAVSEARRSSPFAGPASPIITSRPGETTSGRLEALTQNILDELRRRREEPHADFSVSKLMAGIIQVLVAPVLFFAYVHRGETGTIEPLLLLAIYLQVLTVSLLLAGQQK